MHTEFENYTALLSLDNFLPLSSAFKHHCLMRLYSSAVVIIFVQCAILLLTSLTTIAATTFTVTAVTDSFCYHNNHCLSKYK